MLEDLYSEDLIGDPETLEDTEETNRALFEEDEDNEQNAEETDHVSQTIPQSDNVVQPKKKKVVKNPQPKLDAERLKGPRGLSVLENVFKDYNFCGIGYERKDLDQVMKRLEHWAHRLFPKFQFDDCLEKLETLGHKKPVMTYVKKIRMGLETFESAIVEPEPDADAMECDAVLPFDPFDELISQQISQSEHPQQVVSSSEPAEAILQPPQITLTEEQKERMERNRRIAQERRLARMKALQESEIENQSETTNESRSASTDTCEKTDSASPSGNEIVPLTENADPGCKDTPPVMESEEISQNLDSQFGTDDREIILNNDHVND